MRNLMKTSWMIVALALSNPVLAQYAVTLAPALGPPTQALTVAGKGFEAGEPVDVYVDTVDSLLVIATATGTFSAAVTIPATAQPGNHYVTAIGRKSGLGAQAAFDVYTTWLESGFGAANLGWNPYENTLSPSLVPSLERLWSTTIGNGYGASVLDFGKVFVGSASGSGVFALNAITGAVLWNKGAGSTFFASPAVSATTGGVYIGSYEGTVYDFNEGTGAITWSRALGSPCYAHSASTIVGSVLYTGCGSSVYALNASTGSIIWNYTAGSFVAVGQAVANGVLYTGSYDDKVYALNATTGALIWSYLTSNYVTGSPAVSNGIVYIGSSDDKFYALNALNGALIWSATTGSPIYGSPAVAGGVVYIGSQDGTLYAFNAATGAIEWTYSQGTAISGNVGVADGVVYVGDSVGKVYAVAASNGGYLANFVSGSSVNGTPEVVNGILYVSSLDGNVYAYEPVGPGANALRAAGPPAMSSLHPNMGLVPILSK